MQDWVADYEGEGGERVANNNGIRQKADKPAGLGCTLLFVLLLRLDLDRHSNRRITPNTAYY